MQYKKIKYNAFLKVLYAIAYVRMIEGFDKVYIVKDAMAQYCGVSRMQVHRWITWLEDAGVLSGKIKTRKGDGAKAKSQWAFCGYDVDLKKLESILADNDVEIEGIESLRHTVAAYSNKSRQFSKIKKANPTATEAEITNLMVAAEVLDKEKEDAFFDKLCTKHAYFLERLDWINEFYDGMFHWDYLREHKKRMTNMLCTTKNPEKHPEDSERMNILSVLLGSDDIAEFDVKSSIYNVSYGLGHYKMARLDWDFYRMIFEKSGIDDLPCTGARWKAVRPVVKQIFMPIYMREGSLKRRCKNYEFFQKKVNDPDYYICKHDREEYELNQKLERFFEKDLETILFKLRDAMHEVLNLEKFYRRDIFLYESDLHILIIYHLLHDHKIPVFNVYDGFYYLKDTPNFEKIFNDVYLQSFTELVTVLKDDIEKKRRKAS